MNPIVIEIENLSKQYRLGEIGTGTLSHDLNRWWARVCNKEDKYSKIDQTTSEFQTITEDYLWALRDVNLQIRQGEILGIIGKNGAGKSTLLKIISRITSPTNGTIKVKGRISSLLEVGTGMHMEMTARENIFLNGAILGMNRDEITKKFDEIVNFAEIENFVDTPVKRYSSGMVTRLGFAVAAHLEPEILIIDEVLAVGDAEFQRKCIGKIDDTANKGRTVLFVSHNMGLIKQLCKTSIWLSNGRIKQHGPTQELVSEYMAEPGHYATCNMNALEIEPNKASQLSSFCLHDHLGNVRDVFDCDYPVVLELTFTIRKKLYGLYGYMEIRKRDQTTVLVSDSFDSGTNSMANLDTGKHKILIEIPARSLAAGEYQVYLNFTNSKGKSIDSPGIVAKFRLNDGVSNRGNRRGGFFSTLLNWKVADYQEAEPLN